MHDLRRGAAEYEAYPFHHLTMSGLKQAINKADGHIALDSLTPSNTGYRLPVIRICNGACRKSHMAKCTAVPRLVCRPVSPSQKRDMPRKLQTGQYLWQGVQLVSAEKEGSRCLFG